ncbi:MAG: DedA family protein [Thermoanaerobaculia bacterium]|nr:DedA family protein [Thermoanaerobaculia bacterium]
MTPTSLPLLVVFLGSFLEGELVIVAGAILSARQGAGMTPWEIGGAAVAGTMVGDQLVYWIGRLVKDPQDFELRGRRLLDDRRTRVLEESLESHGMQAVFLFRYAFGLRTLGYFVAGVLRMSYIRFFVADLAGSGTWVAILVALGYGVGRPILRALREGWALAITVPVALVIVWAVIRIQRRLESASTRYASRSDEGSSMEESP